MAKILKSVGDVSFEVDGVKEASKNIDIFLSNLSKSIKSSMELAALNVSEDIKVIFKGGTNPGFKDRTGQLRASIRGGLDDFNSDPDQVVAFVGAGDDRIGSEGKPTKDYVALIEFGEFTRVGSTSFLRAGIEMSKRQINDVISKSISPEKLI